MSHTLHDYHGHQRVLRDATDAGTQFDDQASAIMPHGGSGQTITISTDNTPVLRIDIDIDADRAAVQWLPDGSYAIEIDAGTPITVYASPDDGLRDIPAARVRVTAATAHDLVADYIATGMRPATVTWSAAT